MEGGANPNDNNNNNNNPIPKKEIKFSELFDASKHPNITLEFLINFSPSDLERLVKINPEIRKIIENDFFWKTKIMREFDLSATDVEKLYKIVNIYHRPDITNPPNNYIIMYFLLEDKNPKKLAKIYAQIGNYQLYSKTIKLIPDTNFNGTFLIDASFGGNLDIVRDILKRINISTIPIPEILRSLLYAYQNKNGDIISLILETINSQDVINSLVASIVDYGEINGNSNDFELFMRDYLFKALDNNQIMDILLYGYNNNNPAIIMYIMSSSKTNVLLNKIITGGNYTLLNYILNTYSTYSKTRLKAISSEALKIATKLNNEELIRLLLKAGADPDVVLSEPNKYNQNILNIIRKISGKEE